MERLLKKQELDRTVSKEAFLEDINCLFAVLKDAYGLYGHFGEDAFRQAKGRIMEELEPYEFDEAVFLCEADLL